MLMYDARKKGLMLALRKLKKKEILILMMQFLWEISVS
jgi:hypothetical protein